MKEVTQAGPGFDSLRSLLFCPANDMRKMQKALGSAADAVILDLEDSVAEPDKDAARALAVEALQMPRTRLVVVRVNAADTAHYLTDLVGVMRAAPDAIMLPKCGSMADITRLAAQIEVLEATYGLPAGCVTILPLVTESAAALEGMAYRGASPRLKALCFAAEDLASDFGVMARRDHKMHPLLAQARLQVVLAATAAGLPAIDTPFPNTSDPAGVRQEAEDAAFLGFSGKLCIHPAHVPVLHEAFLPSPEKLSWAKAVLKALENTTTGVGVVDGKMVDLAHLRLARRYLLQAGSEQNS